MHLIPYSIERFEATMSVEQFIDAYRDEAACLIACKACDRYGKNWTCPPFDFDPEELLRDYATMDIICSKTNLMHQTLGHVPVEEYPVYVGETYSLIKLVIEDKLMAQERSEAGTMVLFPGSCKRCPHGCKRAVGEPCVSPATMRYSLEAFGGLLGPLVKDLFGLDFCWSGPEEIPDYFLLVSAVLRS